MVEAQFIRLVYLTTSSGVDSHDKKLKLGRNGIEMVPFGGRFCFHPGPFEQLAAKMDNIRNIGMIRICLKSLAVSLQTSGFKEFWILSGMGLFISQP